MSVLVESLVLILLRAGLFLSCRNYVLNRLYSDLETISTDEVDELPIHVAERGNTLPTATHSTISRAAFALCFSESCMLFVLLMCQGVGIFDPRTRLINWIFSLNILLLTILILNPLIISILVTPTSRKHPLLIRIALSLIPVCIYLFCLSHIPLPSALVGLDLMATSLARLVVLGTIILGLLSGFGAVSSSWAYLSTKTEKELGVPSEREIETAERALERVREDLIARKRQLEAAVSADGVSPSSSASWYSRLVPTLRSSASSDTQAEITGLQMVYSQMEQNLTGLKRRKSEDEFRRTIQGRLYGVGAAIMAIYWMARIIWTTVNVLVYRNLFSPETSSSSTTNYPDIISKLLADLVSFIHRHRQTYSHDHDLIGDGDHEQHTRLDMDLDSINNITRHLSLLFVGLVILTSIRTVLRGVSRVLSHSSLEGGFKLNSKTRTNSRSLGASLMVIILAQLMGIYLISTIVQLRTSFPPPAPRDISSTLSFSTFSSYSSSLSNSHSSDVAETALPSSYLAALQPTAATANEGLDWQNQTSSESTTQTQNLFTSIPSFHPAVFASLFDGSFLLAVGVSGVGRWAAGRVAGWDE